MPGNRTPDRHRRKERRVRLLLDAYGIEPDMQPHPDRVERMRSFLDHISGLAADGSEWELDAARRGVLDELALEMASVKEHAAALMKSRPA